MFGRVRLADGGYEAEFKPATYANDGLLTM